ncbi:hypothetical protein NDN08_001974 [Rhodosorus marinus]|uniref:DUF547 domain-containing protein n=1 Tax=Rhodosorus marinus TaxID=101924 RepID=A0AAV8UWP1_9RHOD|nr:hypothetical protein NDN08_001974 [Rhodosorus marinus]
MLDERIIRSVDALVRPESSLKYVSSGSSIIAELVRAKVAENESDAREIAGILVELKALTGDSTHFVESASYKIPGKAKNAALNSWFESYPGQVRDATNFTQEFNRSVVPVMKAVLYTGGFNVHYDKLRSVPEWWKVLGLLAELGDVHDIGSLEDQPKRAFFFNLLNVMIFHSRTIYKAPDGLRSRGQYFSRIIYTIAGRSYNYMDLEHGALRRKFVGNQNPETLSLMVKTVDPRMHFALNCGAQSCPNIRPYTAEGLEEELEVATREYLQKFTTVRPEKCEIKLPRLLKWFQPDFESVVEINPENGLPKHVHLALSYLSNGQQLDAAKCICMGKRLRVKYRKYDWGDNSIPDSRKEISLMYAYDFSFYLSR